MSLCLFFVCLSFRHATTTEAISIKLCTKMAQVVTKSCFHFDIFLPFKKYSDTTYSKKVHSIVLYKITMI